MQRSSLIAAGSPQVLLGDGFELDEVRLEDEESEEEASQLRMVKTSKQKVLGFSELDLPEIRKPTVKVVQGQCDQMPILFCIARPFITI